MLLSFFNFSHTACLNSIVPDAGVYLVSPLFMASIAASQICCGVSKSGSPTPNVTTSIPSDFNCAAFAEIANVEDGLISNALFDNSISFLLFITTILYPILK